MNSETKSTIFMVLGRLSRKKEIATIPSHNRTQHKVMQQMLRKTQQIKTKRRTEELEDSTAETETESPRNNLERIAMIEVLEISTPL